MPDRALDTARTRSKTRQRPILVLVALLLLGPACVASLSAGAQAAHTSVALQTVRGIVVGSRGLQGGKGELVLAGARGRLLSIIQESAVGLQIGSRISLQARPIRCTTSLQGVCFYTTQRQAHFTGRDATQIKVRGYLWNAYGGQLSFSSIGTGAANGVHHHMQVDVARGARESAAFAVGSTAWITLARVQGTGRFEFYWVVVGVS